MHPSSIQIPFLAFLLPQPHPPGPCHPLASMQRNHRHHRLKGNSEVVPDPLISVIRKPEPSGTLQLVPAGNRKLVQWGLSLLDLNGEKQNKNHRQEYYLLITRELRNILRQVCFSFSNTEGFVIRINC